MIFLFGYLCTESHVLFHEMDDGTTIVKSEERVEKECRLLAQQGLLHSEGTTACPPVVGLTKESVDNSLITAAKALIQPEDEIAKNWQERSYLYGTPEDVVKTLSMWQEVGIEAVYLQLLDLEPSKRDESVEVIRQAINLL